MSYKKIVSLLAVSTLALAACGTDDAQEPETDETEQVDETGENSNIRTDESSSERENLVSAFDTENLSNEGKEINSGNTTISDSGENTNLKNVTRTVQGSLSNKLDDIEKVKSILHKNVLNDIIYVDVVQLVGLSIY